MLSSMTQERLEALSAHEIELLHAWRRRVVRWWIATMIAAVLTWGSAAAFRLPAVAEFALAALLACVALMAVRQTLRGRCPRCGTRIRFEPRVELPLRCSRCASEFVAPVDRDA